MFSHLRRFAGVLLALAMVPAVSGAAQCADHGSVEISESAVVADAAPASASHHHGEHNAGAQSLVEADHGSHYPDAQGLAENHAHDHAAAEAASDEHGVSVVELSQVSEEPCCPAAGAPGECGSAMGCSVMGISPDQRALEPISPVRVIAAEGVEQSPGPSKAPEVPPPRS